MNQLAKTIKEEKKKIFLEFGGQGAPYLKELSKLYKEKPELKDFFEKTFSVLKKHSGIIDKSVHFEHGFDLKIWLENPNEAPDDTYMMRGNISIAGIMVTQSANYYMYLLNGYSMNEIIDLIQGATGHSQGVVAAAMASIAAKTGNFLEVYEKFLEYQLFLGLRAQEAYGTAVIADSLEQESIALGDKGLSPMAVVIGYTADDINSMIDAVNNELKKPDRKIYAALFNMPDSIVISAPPVSMLAFRRKYQNEMNEKKIKYVYLRTTAPFHSPHMLGCREPFMKDLQAIGFNYQSSDLSFPVYSFFDGDDIRNRNEIAVSLFEEVAVKQLFWEKAVKPMRNCDVIFDFGPGKTIQGLTQGWLGDAATPAIYCISNPKDAKVIFG